MARSGSSNRKASTPLPSCLRVKPYTRSRLRWVFLGLLPAPVGGESDITELYLKKLKEWRKLKDKKYQVPLEGWRVFIRAWQQENGWEDKAMMRVTNALVPAGGGVGGRQRQRLLWQEVEWQVKAPGWNREEKNAHTWPCYVANRPPTPAHRATFVLAWGAIDRRSAAMRRPALATGCGSRWWMMTRTPSALPEK